LLGAPPVDPWRPFRLSAQGEYDAYSPFQGPMSSAIQNRKQSRISEISAAKDIVFALSYAGVCAAFSRGMHTQAPACCSLLLHSRTTQTIVKRVGIAQSCSGHALAAFGQTRSPHWCKCLLSDCVSVCLSTSCLCCGCRGHRDKPTVVFTQHLTGRGHPLAVLQQEQQLAHHGVCLQHRQLQLAQVPHHVTRVRLSIFLSPSRLPASASRVTICVTKGMNGRNGQH
jgi:hypothetical protein